MADVDLKILVYGDTNMNTIDGSSVWTQSVTLALAAIERASVTLLLKAPIENDRLTAPLVSHANIDVVDAFGEDLYPDLRNTLSPHQVAQLMIGDNERLSGFDVALIRGYRLAIRLAKEPILARRLWIYLTDIPQTAASLGPESVAELTRIAEVAEAFLCQTEELRTFLEQTIPGTAGRCHLLAPIIPSPPSVRPKQAPTVDHVRLVYAGKFAWAWNTLDMTRLPQQLAVSGIDAELTMIGHKIHNEPDHPGFHHAMRSALDESEGVAWLGGMPRLQALAELANHDFGLSWRHHSLDTSLELSTKLLEYCAAGVPPILNRSLVHEQLFGFDYPLFVETAEDIAKVIRTVLARPERYLNTQARCVEIAEAFTVDSGSAAMAAVLDRLHPQPVSQPGLARQRRVTVISHDLKFFNRILTRLQSDQRLSVAVDEWEALHVHDESRTLELMDVADVVIAEWCGPNAAFASEYKQDGQKLIVRLHRFELYSGYWRKVDIDAVDTVVAVSPYYEQLILEHTGWPAEKVQVIPNFVDVAQLDRAKLPGSRFNLGFIGVAPARKRFDLALAVLRMLRQRDRRYSMFVKTKLPWDYPWIWEKSEEASHYAAAFRTIAEPDVHGAVTFDVFGPDVGAWLRKIGFVLSTSDDESFHLAPAEGMASGAIPIVRDWPGANTIYDDRWIVSTPEEMAARILEWSSPIDHFDAVRADAQDEVRRRYDEPLVTEAWLDLVLDDS